MTNAVVLLFAGFGLCSAHAQNEQDDTGSINIQPVDETTKKCENGQLIFDKQHGVICVPNMSKGLSILDAVEDSLNSGKSVDQTMLEVGDEIRRGEHDNGGKTSGSGNSSRLIRKN